MWEGSTITDIQFAQYYTGVLEKKTVNLYARQHGLFCALIGDPDKIQYQKGSTIDGVFGMTPRARRVEVSGGNEFELGLDAIEGNWEYLSGHDVELEPTDAIFDQNQFGVAKWTLSLLYHNDTVPGSYFEQQTKSKAKFMAFSERRLNGLAESRMRWMQSEFNGTNEQNKNGIGGWDRAIDDTSTYGGLTRSATVNPNWRGKVATGIGGLDVDTHIAPAQTEIISDGGTADIICTTLAIFNDIQEQVRDRQQVIKVGMWDQFGGLKVGFGPSVVTFDNQCPTGKVLIATSESWLIARDDQPIIRRGWTLNTQSRKFAYQMPVFGWYGIICENPRANKKLEGVT